MYSQDGYKVDHAGRRQTFDGWRIPTRQHPNYELVLVVKGYGNIRVQNREYALGPNDLVLFHPYTDNSLWLSQKPYMDFCFVHFTLSDGIEPPPLSDVTHMKSTPSLLVLFNQLFEVWRRKEYLYEWQASLSLQLILVEIYKALHNQIEPVEMQRIRQVLNYIDEDACRDITMEKMLDIAGIGKSSFMASFRKVTGSAPREYIIHSRLEKARDLLEESDFPISVISEMCGFNDALYFSRCFRQHYLSSPRQYRNESRSSTQARSPSHHR